MANGKPVVLLFRDDKKRVDDWVLAYPDNETGGQVFGLWTHDGNPYINIITGPGENCKHRSHSFHQDIDYLKNVGGFLNKEFMMCHIGEWHSHHKLRLRQPSSGDLNSIWKHFPDGVEHFLLIIATIEDDGVRLNPWLFTASSHTYEAIGVKVIDKDNVFMKDEPVRWTILNGAEVKHVQPQSQSQNTLTDYHPPPKGKTYQVTEPGKTQIEGRWYLTDQGAFFVQLLNSKLEKIIDKSTEIEKTFQDQCLRFSFQRKTCRVFLTFPQDFPINSSLKIKCIVPGASDSLKWSFPDVQLSATEIVDSIVQFLKDNVPAVYHGRTLYVASV